MRTNLQRDRGLPKQLFPVSPGYSREQGEEPPHGQDQKQDGRHLEVLFPNMAVFGT